VASPQSKGIFIENERQQRAGLFLRDVKYRLTADFVFIPREKRAAVHNPVPEWLTDNEEKEILRQLDVRPDETEAKYAAMFERRAKKGQCFNQPYLGCREFSCEFRLVDSIADPMNSPGELAGMRDLGWTLYDLDFSDPQNITPFFYKPVMKDGIINVPDRNSEEVKK
jgi:CRISPR-associated protein Cas5d